MIITRRGNIRIPLNLHLTSDSLGDDPVSEVHLLSGEVRKEVIVPIVTQSLSIATEIITLVLTHSGSEKIILQHTEANVTIFGGMSIEFWP